MSNNDFGGAGGGGGAGEIANPWQQFQLQQQQQFQLAQQQRQQQQQQQQQAQQQFVIGGGGAGITTAEAAAWRERERRQRSVRVLMMFLLMLLLMDEDNDEYGSDRRDRLRGGGRGNDLERKLRGRYLAPEVYQARQTQERTLQRLTRGHERYQSLVKLNSGVDYHNTITDWSVAHVDMVRDEFFEPDESRRKTSNAGQDDSTLSEDDAAAASQRVWHYPWNTTGFYRGDWKRVTEIDELIEAGTIRPPMKDPLLNASSPRKQQTPKQMEAVLLEELRHRKQVAAVLPFPLGFELIEWSNGNSTYSNNETANVEHVDDATSSVRRRTTESIGAPAIVTSWDADSSLSAATVTHHTPAVTLNRDDGRAAFQLFSKSIAGLSEVSLISGFIKLYDSTAAGYSTRKDVLLRVRGVLLHSIGRVSLVANVATNSVALVLDEELPDGPVGSKPSATSASSTPQKESTVESRKLHRRLQQLLSQVKSPDGPSLVNQIRTDVLAMENSTWSSSVSRKGSSIATMAVTDASAADEMDALLVDPWSNTVIPYPFVRDDQFDSIRTARTPASRTMPVREQALEANAAGCVFEINLDVTPIEWTVGDWRKLVARRVEEAVALNPANAPSNPIEVDADSTSDQQSRSSHRRTMRTSRRVLKKLPEQALVMNMVGTIHSCNCNFTAFLNTTALRTDWEATTSKAINYSFYMMIVCLTQILILLRQLLHSQSQSTATRVSLLCVGWQTIIDALMCLAHIYLSLAVQPLFTAFASVAFFKLLIFCVIEMKYMAIIIQARNSSSGGQPADVLRHQVAMLHLRFYGSLMATFLLLFYAQNKYRLFYMLALYSFWVPQIILNIITEAKTPLHKYYIYGMSITRMVAPLYIFGLSKNFLKEVYPESATEPFMCQMVVLWVACQTAILIAQGKYGARFMIPARFLPPKFDYRRPIPASMLPPGALVDLPTPELMDERDDGLRCDSPSKRDELDTSSPVLDGAPQAIPLRHPTAETTRNRLKGNRNAISNGTAMTTEDLTVRPPAAAPAPAPVLECSICYDDIDVRDRDQYMLAPCNHLFHAECLKQWMDVKMECPICRTELPAL